MFLAALRSLSCSVPQLLQSHVLSTSLRFGLSAPHPEQSFVLGSIMQTAIHGVSWLILRVLNGFGRFRKPTPYNPVPALMIDR